MHERVAVGDTTTPLGEGVVGEAVGDLAVGVVTAPPAERDGDDTGAKTFADPDGNGH